jgi:hypothetical protein
MGIEDLFVTARKANSLPRPFEWEWVPLLLKIRILELLDKDPGMRRAASLPLAARKVGPFKIEAADRLALLPGLVLLLTTIKFLRLPDLDAESRSAAGPLVAAWKANPLLMHLEGEEVDRLVHLPFPLLLLPMEKVLWRPYLDSESRRAAGLSLAARKARLFEREEAPDQLVPLLGLVLLFPIKRALGCPNPDPERRRAAGLLVVEWKPNPFPMYLEGEGADRLMLLSDLVRLMPTRRLLWRPDLDSESRRAAGLLVVEWQANPLPMYLEGEEADRLAHLLDLVLLLPMKRILGCLALDVERMRAAGLLVAAWKTNPFPMHLEGEEAGRLVLLLDLVLL